MACARICRIGFQISIERPERVLVLPADQSVVEHFVLVDEPCRAGRGGTHERRDHHLEIRHQRCDRSRCRTSRRLRSAFGSLPAVATNGATSTASRIFSNIWRSRARDDARARQIAEEIEAVGGDLNAATSAENTAYYARMLKADVPLALDVLADILSEPAFDRGELAARAEASSCRKSAPSPTRRTI